MKNLFFITLSLVLLTSCGLQRQIDELKNREAQAEIDSQNRDAALQSQISNLELSLKMVSAQLLSMDAAFEESNSSLSEQEEEIRNAVTALQTQQSILAIQLASLQGYTNIVSVKNPCGVQAANEEVFLKLSNGRFLASFSDSASGSNTRFALLSDGNFRTTDGTNCNFTISGSGTVVSNEHN